MSNVEQKYQSVLERVAAAEKRGGRAPGSTTLIAVTKTKTVEAIMAAHRAGAMHFGENYVQEALKKIEKIQAPIHWHLIGHLQTNKAKSVVGKFATIQSVDRFELAKALNTRAQEGALVQNILIQVKVGDEPTKGGISPTEVPELLEKMSELKNLKIEGFMSLPPIEAEPEGSRKYFIQLRELFEKLKGQVPKDRGSFSQLSMGTTHDFEVAIEEGATMVRVGTAIFGAREVGVQN